MDSTVLITGAMGGLGRSVVESFSADGWRIVAPARSPGSDDPAKHPPGLEVIEADLTDATAVQHVVQRAAGQASAPLRAVVNLVGGYAGGPRVHETPIEDFERQFRLNLRPTYLVTQAALPHLRDGGTIVCVSSRAAVQPFSGAAGYIAAKAAVIAFAQAVAIEYRDEGIRCNAVLPSVIDTPSNRALSPRPTNPAGSRPTTSPRSSISCAPTNQMRSAAPRSPSTGAPDEGRGIRGPSDSAPRPRRIECQATRRHRRPDRLRHRHRGQ